MADSLITPVSVVESVRRGATAVILSDAEDAASTRELFDAGLALKERLRGRAALFVADRTDIAASVEADGVVGVDAEAGGVDGVDVEAGDVDGVDVKAGDVDGARAEMTVVAAQCRQSS